MQTPAGYEIVNNQVIPTDWWAVIFNPSFPYRLAHMVMAAFLVTALIVGASAAWHLRRKNDTPAIRTMLSLAMWQLLSTEEHTFELLAHRRISSPVFGQKKQ